MEEKREEVKGWMREADELLRKEMKEKAEREEKEEKVEEAGGYRPLGLRDGRKDTAKDIGQTNIRLVDDPQLAQEFLVDPQWKNIHRYLRKEPWIVSQ